MPTLTGRERIAVYGGPSAVDVTNPLDLTVADLENADDSARLVLASGGQDITAAAFITVATGSDRATSPLRVGLESGGAWFSPLDYYNYLHTGSIPGISTDLRIVQPGHGWVLDETFSIGEDPDDPSTEARGQGRVTEVGPQGEALAARLIRPYYYQDVLTLPWFATSEDSHGDETKVRMEVSRVTIDGVIYTWDLTDDGDGFSIGDTGAITSPGMGGVDAEFLVLSTTNDLIDPVVISANPQVEPAITAVSQGDGTVTFAGDLTSRLPEGRIVIIDGSTGNDDAYAISDASFATGHTTCTLLGSPRGTITIDSVPDPGDTVSVKGTTFTFQVANVGMDPLVVVIGLDENATATALAAAITTWVGTLTGNNAVLSDPTVDTAIVTIISNRPAPSREAVTLAKTGTHISVSGATLAYVETLPDDTADGTVVVGPDIAVDVGLVYEGDTDVIEPTALYKFSNVFIEDNDNPKTMDVIQHRQSPLTRDLGTGELHVDRMNLFVSPYASGSPILVDPLDIALSTARGCGPIDSMDLTVFGSGFTEDPVALETGDIVGATGGEITITATLDYPPV